MDSILSTYPSAVTSTDTVPSSIPVNEQPPALPVVLLVSPIVTVAPCIALVPSFIVNDMLRVVATLAKKGDLILSQVTNDVSTFVCSF